jgi:integrase
MTAYMLGLYTGQRLGDVVKMSRKAYDGTAIEVRQSKTDELLWIPAHKRLRAYLDGLPKTTMLFVTKADGTGWTESGLSHAFKKATKAAGLSGVVFHGLRHTAGKKLAEAGCTNKEIQAVLGHRNSQMADHYSRAAEQKILAKRAIERRERMDDEKS